MNRAIMQNMISYCFLLLYTSMAFSSSEDESWQEPLITAEVGDSVNLACLCKKRMTTIVWLRQSLGEKPYVIATSYQFQSAMFYNNFDKSGRYSATIGPFSFNLSISNLKLSDSATYYCAITFLYDITFEQGTVLIVKDRSLKRSTLVQTNNLVGSGDPGTQCTLVTDRCVGNHSIFWFRHSSGESQPGIIYTQGPSSDHCKKSFSNGSMTQTCVYSLPKNLSLSNTGTYYCAVAACGEILFENKITQIATDSQLQIRVFVVLSIIRSAVVLFVFTVCLLYIFICHH